MRLEGLDISNFLIFDEDQSLTLPAADDLMLLIKGERDGTGTENSNGSGKSSLMEAVYWAATGKTVRGGTTKQVPRFGSKQCSVTAHFIKRGGIPYKIKRLWSPSIKSVGVLDGDEEHFFHTADEGTKRIAADLGLFHTDLLALTTFFGRRFPAFSRLSPSEKASIIDILADAEKWDARRMNAGRLAKNIAGDLNIKQSNLAISLDELKRTQEDATDLKDEIRSLNEVYDEHIKNAEAEIAIEQHKINEAQEEESSLLATVEKLQNEVGKTAQQVNDLEKDQIKLNGEVNKAHSTLQDWQSMGADLERSRAALERAKKDGICPKCKRDWKEGNHELQKEIDEITAKFKDIDIKSDEAVNEIRSLEALGEELKEMIQQLKDSVATPSRQVNEVRTQIRNVNVRLTDAKSKKQRLEVQLARIKERTDIKSREGRLQELENREEKLRRDTAETSGEIQDLRSEIVIWKYWEQAFKVIRFKVLEATVELLQRTLTSIAVGGLGLDADEILVSMFKDGSKSKRAEVTITVRRGEHEVPLGMLSDGESQRMDLACFIALGSLVKQITGMDFGFRVFDEPLTNLDADGKFRAFHLIKEIPEAQKFVIDHDAHFQDMFDKSVTIIKKGDRSCISA